MFGLVCAACVEDRSCGRRAVNGNGGKSVRHSLKCGEKEVGMHTNLLMSIGGDLSCDVMTFLLLFMV